jgi:hypothetical protein
MDNTGKLYVYYPDGTKNLAPPVDGYTFVTQSGDKWTWDAQLYHWVRGYGGDHSQVKPGDIQDFSRVVLDNLHNIAEPVCECGKDKHGFANHTRWCAKWSDEW